MENHSEPSVILKFIKIFLLLDSFLNDEEAYLYDRSSMQENMTKAFMA